MSRRQDSKCMTSNTTNSTAMTGKRIDWPRNDYSRVPNWVYHDPELFGVEQERIFQGPTWMYVGLEAEIPNPGDFRTTYLGKAPVVFNRARDGKIHCFVNRCAHRGALVCRKTAGNSNAHTCIYHQWTYDLTGKLIGVPFQRGIGGQGGTSADFKREEHGLRALRVAVYKNVIFASFSPDTLPLDEYLGSTIAAHLARVMKEPLRVLGYQRQHIRGNWKLYAENVRDQYHGSLLHQFQGTFLTRTTTEGGLIMDDRHRHSIIYSTPGKDLRKDARSSDADIVHGAESFKDTRLLEFKPEFGDNRGSTICAFFPNATFQQIRNGLAVRQIRPLTPDSFDLFWTLFGYQSDSESMTKHRLLQANLGGPAGYISLEDGEAIEIVQKATAGGGPSTSVVEMGGAGKIPTQVTTRMNDIAVRGFWSYYSELMDTEPPDAIR
jgi:anthranilate 1,2-dioxygenase large subunit